MDTAGIDLEAKGGDAEREPSRGDRIHGVSWPQTLGELPSNLVKSVGTPGVK